MCKLRSICHHHDDVGLAETRRETWIFRSRSRVVAVSRNDLGGRVVGLYHLRQADCFPFHFSEVSNVRHSLLLHPDAIDVVAQRCTVEYFSCHNDTTVVALHLEFVKLLHMWCQRRQNGIVCKLAVRLATPFLRCLCHDYYSNSVVDNPVRIFLTTVYTHNTHLRSHLDFQYCICLLYATAIGHPSLPQIAPFSSDS